MSHSNERWERKQRHRKRVVEWNLAEIPMQLIRNMAQLKLEPIEVVFLAYLLAVDVGWKEGKSVALPLREIRQATGLSIGTIHKAKRGLVAKGFMTILNIRNKARTNTYDFSTMTRTLEGALNNH